MLLEFGMSLRGYNFLRRDIEPHRCGKKETERSRFGCEENVCIFCAKRAGIVSWRAREGRVKMLDGGHEKEANANRLFMQMVSPLRSRTINIIEENLEMAYILILVSEHWGVIVLNFIKDLSHIVLWKDLLFGKQPRMCEVASDVVRKCVKGSTVQVQNNDKFMRDIYCIEKQKDMFSCEFYVMSCIEEQSEMKPKSSTYHQYSLDTKNALRMDIIDRVVCSVKKCKKKGILF